MFSSQISKRVCTSNSLVNALLEDSIQCSISQVLRSVIGENLIRYYIKTKHMVIGYNK